MCYLGNLPLLLSLLRANLCQRDKLAWHKTIVLRLLKLLQYYLLPFGGTLCVQLERTYRVYEPVSDQGKEELKRLESKRHRRFRIAFES